MQVLNYLHRHHRKLLAILVFLTFDLIVFGAFVRLTDSGLGCPDWPGCYGHLTPIQAAGHIEFAQAALPDGPVTWFKAWVEMLHRYVASFIGFLCILLAISALTQRRVSRSHRLLAVISLVWVILQGIFGMWTVTLKLMPIIVVSHLLGGITLLLLLIACQHTYSSRSSLNSGFGSNFSMLSSPSNNKSRWIFLGLVVLYIQIFLGGWVSTNYATLACDHFPQCTQAWLPPADYGNGFQLFRPLGLNADGSALPFDALVAIHLVHRFFALVVTAYLVGLFCLVRANRANKKWKLLVIFALTTQVLSGIATVYFEAPLLLALLHTASASLMAAGLTKWWLSERTT